jgi:hypothetical protein
MPAVQIEPINLRERLTQSRLSFDAQLATVLVGRPELPYLEVGKEFGVSYNVIRRVRKQFNIGSRKRGPKPKQSRKAEQPRSW